MADFFNDLYAEAAKAGELTAEVTVSVKIFQEEKPPITLRSKVALKEMSEDSVEGFADDLEKAESVGVQKKKAVFAKSEGKRGYAVTGKAAAAKYRKHEGIDGH